MYYVLVRAMTIVILLQQERDIVIWQFMTVTLRGYSFDSSVS